LKNICYTPRIRYPLQSFKPPKLQDPSSFGFATLYLDSTGSYLLQYQYFSVFTITNYSVGRNPAAGNRFGIINFVFVVQSASDESYKDPTNLQAKIQKHQAFEAEVAAHSNAIVVLDNTGSFKQVFLGPEGVVGLGSGSVADPESGAFLTPGSRIRDG
jgi:hypothetical protein